jgi:hypothetical protein
MAYIRAACGWSLSTGSRFQTQISTEWDKGLRCKTSKLILTCIFLRASLYYYSNSNLTMGSRKSDPTLKSYTNRETHEHMNNKQILNNYVTTT